MGNQALPWSGLRDAKPKRGEEGGVRGDRAPSDLVFVECRGRNIEGAERGMCSPPPPAFIAATQDTRGVYIL